MDVNDQLKCAIGREKLYRLQREYTFRWMSSAVLPTARCEVPDACRTIAAQMETMSVDLIPRVRALDNWVPEIKNSLCAKCERVGMAEFHSARKSLWNLLPLVCRTGKMCRTNMQSRCAYFLISLFVGSLILMT